MPLNGSDFLLSGVYLRKSKRQKMGWKHCYMPSTLVLWPRFSHVTDVCVHVYHHVVAVHICEVAYAYERL
jgi:hypothetical protein